MKKNVEEIISMYASEEVARGEKVLEEFRETFPEYEVELTSVRKTNEPGILAISVKTGGDAFASIPLKNIDGTPQCWEAIRHQLEAAPKALKAQVISYNPAELRIQVINSKLNCAMLKDVPHRMIADDLALIVRKLCSDGSLVGSFIVNNSMLKNWGVSEKDLFNEAVNASIENEPARFMKMSDMMAELMPGTDLPEPDSMPLHVATNKSGRFGAAVIAYPGFLDSVHEKMGDFWIIPSSIHEVIIYGDGLMESEELAGMIQSVNEEAVEVGDFLSDHPYFYDGNHIAAK